MSKYRVQLFSKELPNKAIEYLVTYRTCELLEDALNVAKNFTKCEPYYFAKIVDDYGNIIRIVGKTKISSRLCEF